MTNGSTWEISVPTDKREAIGLDLSDKSGTYVVVGALGQVTAEGKVEMTQAGLKRIFGSRKPTRVAIEVGTHSPWVSRLLAERWPRSDRGQRPPGEADQPEQSQE
jgi:hypothetical protein